MSQLGFKSAVYHGEVCLGELETVPMTEKKFQFPNNEIRIHHISPQSERCPPLSVLQTISSFSVRCKLEPAPSPPEQQPHLINLHASCFHEFKTAVVLIGNEEIHLVAMPSKQKKFPCFWCFSVPIGLYNSCLALLNLRCLAIVFDLDETLIVANTMKSFEDRIEALKAWIGRETDPMRISGMYAELRRYTEDRLLLKQFTESDFVMDNSKMLKVQLEEVAPLSDTHERVFRPVIRMPDRNIVLTRINPEIRDTSVLVRLRPAWEDLRSYLTAKGRKRFEVYVCTMAERDYALEMWRLLDPEAKLISSKQLLDRIICVKSGSRKSLLNVFHDGMCHPKMAMVIDDRSKVWEDKDQPRVHVVPAFTPYYAPQAETANAVPILCVARNVACNVRGCFFKEFDESLLRRIAEVFYEDEVISLPTAPDVSNYMFSEDAGFVPNGNGNTPIAEGMYGGEVEFRMSQSDEKNAIDAGIHSVTNNPESRSEISQPLVGVAPNVVGTTSSTTAIPPQKSSLLGAPLRRDIRNQNLGQPPLLSRVPTPTSLSTMLPQGTRMNEEDINRAQINSRSSGFVQEGELQKFNKPSAVGNLFTALSSAPTGLVSHAPQVKMEEASCGYDTQKQSIPSESQPSEIGMPQNPQSSNSKELQNEAGKLNLLPSHFSIGVLQEIGRRCNSKVEFRSVVSTSKELQFSVEVLFTGEKIGVGMGKTRKDAQQQAAENALRSLAEKYVAYFSLQCGAEDRDLNDLSQRNDNGFLWDVDDNGSSEAVHEDEHNEHTNEAAEADPATTHSNSLNQQVPRRANSPSYNDKIAAAYAK
ncbi:hypothetical protein K2173_000003 [Erythroxylum novogranatense]|uniref:protein-serine/threonine phosphatase n=1 Tax=Erythroxylum novogranatense TaxID=1862640 RepID=A0AAV8SP82_9ROSI|nr:hypothetical protein K2173_000003 [Erythroxylum novogranatense]